MAINNAINKTTSTLQFTSANGILDANGLNMISFVSAASAVNNVQFSNSATGLAPVIEPIGSDTHIGLTIKKKGNGNVDVQGCIDGSSAPAGYLGEYISQGVLVGSAPGLTSTVTANITSISLTAGDWDVTGTVQNAPGPGTTTASWYGGISTTSATLPTIGAENNCAGFANMAALANFLVGVTIGPMRINLAATTTVYLVVNSVFAVSSQNAYGFIGARRVR